MSSKDFQDFVRTCFPKTYGEWHDGLDYDALIRLTGNERIEAEKLILANIPKPGHGNNSIEAAGYLRLQSASELLKKEIIRTQVKRWLEAIFLFLLFLFRHEYYLERLVKLAWALYQIEKYPKSLQVIISELEKPVLTKNPPSFSQMCALRTLISFGDEPDAIEYLNTNIKRGRFVFDSLYALEAIKDGSRLPFESSSDIYLRVQNQLAYSSKTWEQL